MIPDYHSLIHSCYNLLLDREPDQTGYQNFKILLENGMTKDQLLKEFLKSKEFQQRLSNNQDVASWFSENSNYQGRWSKLGRLKAMVSIPLKIPNKDTESFVLQGSASDKSILSGIIDSDGVWEPHITNFLSKYLKFGDTFVDVGANLGYMSILAGKLVGSKGKVISFEPLSINLDILKNNININRLTNIKTYKLGLWFEKSNKEIVCESDFLGGAHLSANGIEGNEPIKELIECVPLDDVDLGIDRMDYLKIDIEGAEPFALEGMRNTITKYKPILLMEINRYCLRNFFNTDTGEVWKILKSMGYNILVFPEQYDLNLEIETKYFNDENLMRIENVEQLNQICSENDLIDIIAIPV